MTLSLFAELLRHYYNAEVSSSKRWRDRQGLLPKGAHTLRIILMAVLPVGQGPECGRVPQGRDRSVMSETGSWAANGQ